MKSNCRTGIHRVFTAVLTAVFAFVLTSAVSIAVYADSATDLPAGEPNLEAALEEYGASPNDVIYVDTAGDIATALKRAERIAEYSRRAIVYLPPGTYRISSHINVPENVVLVAEDDSLITISGNDSYLVRLSGSMYGGVYDSNYSNKTGKKNIPIMDFLFILTIAPNISLLFYFKPRLKIPQPQAPS